MSICQVLPNEQAYCAFISYYLSVPSIGATIEEIDDLEDIVSDPEPSSDDETTQKITKQRYTAKFFYSTKAIIQSL